MLKKERRSLEAWLVWVMSLQTPDGNWAVVYLCQKSTPSFWRNDVPENPIQNQAINQLFAYSVFVSCTFQYHKCFYELRSSPFLRYSLSFDGQRAEIQNATFQTLYGGFLIRVISQTHVGEHLPSKHWSLIRCQGFLVLLLVFVSETR